MIFGRKVERTRSGRYRIRLSPDERQLLRHLPEQLKELLGQPDQPSLRRLFPPAYVEDPKSEAEYRRLVGGDLLEGRQAALDVMAATIDQSELDEEQITAWLSCLNDLRLVLGTELDIQEDEEPGETPIHQLYDYLSALVGAIVSAMSSQFD